MVETLHYSKILTEDIDFGTSSREIRLQNAELVMAQQFDPGWELAYRSGDLRGLVGQGRTIVVSRPTTLTADLTIPVGDTLYFSEGGSLVLQADLVILGGVQAGRAHIFTGSGTVTGPATLDWAFPEWFGAAGDGTTYDHIAWQKTVDFHPRVLGRPGATYLMDCQYRVFSPYDLHNRAKIGAAISFSAGLWAAVCLPSGCLIEGATFALNTAVASSARKQHLFALGDATSVTRHTHSTLRACTFRRAAASPTLTSNWLVFVAQSCDNFVVENNIFDDRARADGNEGGYGALYDCNGVTFRENYGHTIYNFLIAEYSKNLLFANNIAYDCKQMVDLDKRDDHIKMLNNHFDRSSREIDQTDSVYECNGTDQVSLVGNTTNNAFSGVTYSVKKDLRPTWADVLAGTGVGVTEVWENITQAGNVWTNLSKHGLVLGANWLDNPHDGEFPGRNIAVSDVYDNCGIDSTAAGQGVIVIHEGRNIALDVIIQGSSGHGVIAESYIETEAAGAGTYSTLRIVRFSGIIENCLKSGVRIAKAELVNFTGLVCRNNAVSATPEEQVAIIQLEKRAATILGTLHVLRPTSSTPIDYGIRLNAGTVAAGDYFVHLVGTRSESHVIYDLYLDAPSLLPSNANVHFSECTFEKTSLNLDQMLSCAPQHVLSTTAPPITETGLEDAQLVIGTLMRNSVPAPGRAYGWVQTVQGVIGEQAPLPLPGAVARTSNLTLTLAQSGSTYSNAGAAGTVTLTLPQATPGLYFRAIRIAAFSFRLDPFTGQTIRGGGGGKYLQLDAVGDIVWLECLTAGSWEIMSSRGTPSFEP